MYFPTLFIPVYNFLNILYLYALTLFFCVEDILLKVYQQKGSKKLKPNSMVITSFFTIL